MEVRVLKEEGQSLPEEPEKKKFSIKQPNGEWEEIEVEPLSDDPKINTIGAYSMGKIEEILRNPDHEEFQAATEYTRLSKERLSKAFEPLLKTFNFSPLANAVDVAAKFAVPKFNVPGINKLMGLLPEADLPELKSPYPLRISPITSPQLFNVEDLEIEPRPTAEQFEHLILATRETNSHMAKLLGDSNDALVLARAQAEGAEKQAAMNLKQASRNLTAAWIAIVITVVVGITEIILTAISL